ncbi:LysR family transcriptional regulator [Caballeronia temeraria]|uniref:LysR family transcriptional regulator n=1 Tax=Caballeronia temeraria TaxID=1777137 RepID=A0A158CK96_9BURK|nr:LysR family transcriptional regulator [Caballeronia temeraria]
MLPIKRGVHQLRNEPFDEEFKRRISLTEPGEIYAKRVRENPERLERDMLVAMARRSAGGILELAVIPTFATRWLIPRLPAFYAQHDDIVVNLTTRAAPFLFKDTPFDAAIHFGDPLWPGSVAKYLFGEEITAVCSPRLLAGKTKLTPRDVAGFTLLHQSARPDAWRQWLAQAALHDIDSMKGQRYELFSMLVEAAKAGLGIALVPRFLVAHELRARELVRPFDLPLRSDKGYYLVYPERKQNSALLRTFEDWLLTTAHSYIETQEWIRPCHGSNRLDVCLHSPRRDCTIRPAFSTRNATRKSPRLRMNR